MTGGDDDYVYDEASGEWLSAGDIAARDAADAAGPEVRDAVGNLLSDGDSVVLVKDLTVKGAGQTLKVGTVIRSIRLTGDAQEIDCRHDGIKGLVLRAEFVRKR
jgi:protein PhnA